MELQCSKVLKMFSHQICGVLGVLTIQCLLRYVASAFAQCFLDKKGVGLAMRNYINEREH